MKPWIRIGTAVTALTLLMTVLAAAPGLAAKKIAWSTSPVAFFDDPATKVGKSDLLRTRHGVVATFRTTGLSPREALTIWWVVFNNPDGCTDPCGEDDIFIDGDPTKGLNFEGIAAADIVAGYADGMVTNKKGKAFSATWLGENDSVKEIIFGEGPVLKDSFRAEVHLVARSHGPAVRGQVREQTGSYAGGCEVFLHPPERANEVGECVDVQFAIHLP